MNSTPPLIPLESNPQFQTFWEAYPRKQAKLVAERAFRIAIRKVSLECLLNALKQAKASEQWQRGIIPHAATWMHQERWNDVINLPKSHRGNF